MKCIKKILLIITISIFKPCIMSIEKPNTHDNTIKSKHTIDLIVEIEKSTLSCDQTLFKKLLEIYIHQFYQVYEQEKSLLGNYTTTYYIASQENYLIPIDSIEKNKLLKILNQAVLKNNWGDCVHINLPVIHLGTLITTKKYLNLDEIIKAIEQVITPIDNNFNPVTVATITILSGLAISSYYYYFIKYNEKSIKSLSNAWQNLKNRIHTTIEYISEPQNYLQLEKMHNLEIHDMTIEEREQRFFKWRAEKKIQLNFDNQMIQVKQFEKKMGLPSDNMLDEDRIAIYKAWQKEERANKQIANKMFKIEIFEKKHNLLSDTMNQRERIKRYQEWHIGDRNQKKIDEKMKPVKIFEKEHGLLSDTMNQQERINRYQEWHKGDTKQKAIDNKMIEVKKFEKNMELSSDNMHYEDRIKIFDAWQAEQNYEKMIMAMILWEDSNKDNSWLMEDEERYDYDTRSWTREKKDLNETERIERYKRKTDSIQRWFLENQDTMKKVENFENKMNLSANNMYYQDRVKIFSEWQQDQIREKAIKGMQAWETKFNKSIISNEPVFKTMNNEDRINRYRKFYGFEYDCEIFTNPSIEDIEKFEKLFELTPHKKTNELRNMTEEERLERYKYGTTKAEKVLWENFGYDFNIF